MEKTKGHKGKARNLESTYSIVNRLKQKIVEDGLITKEALSNAQAAARRENKPLSRMLEPLGIIKTAHMANFIGSKLSIPYVNLNDYKVDRKALNFFPRNISDRYNIMPLFISDNVLTVAISDPIDILSIDVLSRVAGCEIDFVIASSESIGKAIDRGYGAGKEKTELIKEISGEFQRTKKDSETRTNQYTNEINEIRLRKASEEASIVRRVNGYIAQAMVEGATDIHLEPKKETMHVRYRIDGYLYKRHTVSSKSIAPVISRIKLMSGLDITLGRRPQEGRIELRIKEKDIDIRTSVFPSMFGENVVLRILDKTAMTPQLSEIGLSEEHLVTFRRLTKATRGMVLATGPSGSGKTTTIYSLIESLNKSEKNIVTIEDPVEHEIEGIVQSQIDHAAGMNFADALGSIMRQDPDIVYLGEIRDRETATGALRAALTGKLILSTMHTGSAVGTITRLREMGLGAGLVESVLSCAFAQRLVRRLCIHCRQAYAPEEGLLKELGLPLGTYFYKEIGCDDCSGIGYKGRIGLFEVFIVDRHMKSLISERASEQEMIKAARANDMKSLFEDGMQKILQGMTTLEEVKKACEEIQY